MGAIGGMLGLGGGASGTGFSAPQGAPIVAQTNQGQLDTAYGQNQNTLQQQQSLQDALAMYGQGGLKSQQQAYGSLSNLSGQLGQIAAGQGPNPAQAMLNQQTGANVANQAALMAGQRGVGANTGLLARQAAMQGGNLQQQAVGQGATMQAQQSLGALGQQAGVIGQMGGIANTQVANQMAGQNALTGAQQAEQGQLLNAMGQTNNAAVANQGNINSANASMTGTGMQGQQSMIGGLLNKGLGPASSLIGGMFASGGAVAGYAGGGMPGAQSSFGQFLNGVSAPAASPVENAAYPSGPNQGAEDLKKALSSFGPSMPGASGDESGSASTQLSGLGGEGLAPASGLSGVGAMATMAALSSGGTVDIVVSPGEKIVPPGKVNEAAGGRVEAKTVPGKAKVKGDSQVNDTVKVKAPVGSIVVPRTKAKDEKSSAEFVRKTLARRGSK